MKNTLKIMAIIAMLISFTTTWLLAEDTIPAREWEYYEGSVTTIAIDRQITDTFLIDDLRTVEYYNGIQTILTMSVKEIFNRKDERSTPYRNELNSKIRTAILDQRAEFHFPKKLNEDSFPILGTFAQTRFSFDGSHPVTEETYHAIFKGTINWPNPFAAIIYIWFE